jgi:hypothetical protein
MTAALVSALGAGGAACLAPQWIEGEPAPENAPPTLDERSVSPSTFRVCLSDLDDPPVEFRVDDIRDPDGVRGQALAARWFIDTAPGSSTPNYLISQTLSPQQQDPERYTPAVLPATRIGRRELGASGSVHTIEVFVSDGFDSTGVKEPIGRATDPGFYADSYKWTVIYRGSSPCADE